MTTVQVADLDAQSVYWGLKDKQLVDVVAGDVVFGAEAIAPVDRVQGAFYIEGGCDLPPGTQKWMPGTQRFEPLKRAEIPAGRAVPMAERALYALVLQHLTDGITVPQYTLDWALWYETTLDAAVGTPVANWVAQQAALGSPQ